jgi:hypothetical protein
VEPLSSEYTPRILWFMSYALLGFDDVNRALHNAALRLMGGSRDQCH